MALPLTLIVVTGEIDLSVASMLGLMRSSHGGALQARLADLAGDARGGRPGHGPRRVQRLPHDAPRPAVAGGDDRDADALPRHRPGDPADGHDRRLPAHLTNIGVVPIPGTHIPYSIAFFGVLAVVFAVVLHATPLGRAIFAIGAGQEAAFFAGIRVKRIKFWLYVLSGMLCGFAGVLWTLRFASARYDAGVGMELYVVTIVLLGGISIFGGRGTIAGVVLAVAVLGCLQTALTADLDAGAGSEHRRRRPPPRERDPPERRRDLPARPRAAAQRGGPQAPAAAAQAEGP